MLKVTMLGGASFSANGAILKSDLGPAGRLLACYLFEFAGRAHRRERLADLFWDGLDQDRARSALNTAIWRIRKMLDLGATGIGRHLVTVGEDVFLEASPSIQVDTHELQNAAKRMLDNSHGKLSASEVHAISAAVEAYTGPFLEGYEGDWVLQERERLHCLYVRSAFALMRANAAQGQYERALEYGRRILAIDALRENIQRDVILLLVLNGQRAEAVRSYKRFVVLLKSELDIEPMPETQHLYNRILAGDIFDGGAIYHVANFTAEHL